MEKEEKIMEDGKYDGEHMNEKIKMTNEDKGNEGGGVKKKDNNAT